MVRIDTFHNTFPIKYTNSYGSFLMTKNGYLSGFSVRQQHRGKGLSRKLFKRALRICKSLGNDVMFWDCYESMVGYYENLGACLERTNYMKISRMYHKV